MGVYLIVRVAAAGCGPSGLNETVSADSMEKALTLWVSQEGWVQLVNNPLQPTHLAPITGRAPQIFPAAPGRWYAGAVQLAGPVHHTREDWETAIGLVVAAAQEHHRLNPPQLPQYSGRRRYRKDWWKDDYVGKIDPSQL